MRYRVLLIDLPVRTSVRFARHMGIVVVHRVVLGAKVPVHVIVAVLQPPVILAMFPTKSVMFVDMVIVVG